MIDESIFRGKKLAVVGNICRDVKTAPIAPDPRLFDDGETPTGFLVETIGGGGANSALSAAGLGANVRLGGKIGVDALGERLEALMVAHGVKSFLRRDPVTPTGTSIALSFTNGCRHFVSCQPNNDNLCFEDIDLGILGGGGHLLRADLWFSEPMLFGGNVRLLAAAQDRGMATSIDLNWDPLWGSATDEAIRKRKQAVRQVLPLADLVHGNIRELTLFADAPNISAALERLAAWGAKAVVVHLGAKGAGYYWRDRLIVEPAAPARQQVNTTGTGDLLSTCMMLAHAQANVPVVEKLRLANRIVAEFIAGKRNLIPPL